MSRTPIQGADEPLIVIIVAVRHDTLSELELGHDGEREREISLVHSARLMAYQDAS